MFKRLLIVIVFSVVVFGGLFGTKVMQIQSAMANRQAPPPPVVAVTEVRQEVWQPSLSAVGSLSVDAGIDISNEVPGMVKAFHFKSGQRVKAGQLLVELDTSTDEAELDRLEAAQRLAKVKFDRSKQLIGKKMTSQSDYDENKALLQGADASVTLQKALLEKKKIRAPFDGRLGIRQVSLGEYLPVGTAIVSLNALELIHADFTLPERSLSKLAEDQKIRVGVQAYPDELFEGTVTAITPSVDISTRSIRVRADLENPDEKLQPGMFAYIEVLMPEEQLVLTLPDTAITYNPYGEYVFVVESSDEGEKLTHRQIETGATRDGRVEIISGLEAGERVISAGQVKLRNGMVVKIDSKAAPAERESAE
jgi:membrane fusion protein (multidrug efflux system)